MNRFLPLYVCLAAFLLCVPALAADETTVAETDAPAIIQTTEDENGVTVNVTILPPETAAETSAAADPAVTQPAAETATASPSAADEQTYSVASLDSPAALTVSGTASTMSDVVTGVLGEYHQKTNTVNTYASDGTLVSTTTEAVPGIAGLDYAWIAGAFLFATMVYGILRIIGGLLKL